MNLPLVKGKNMEEALVDMCKIDKLTKDNKYHCPKCNKK
jgi:ubiquitin C-terminal hydrolase